ncbi:carbohydrate-binding protein AQN-1-like [Sapajus apella]|uniref:Carbohydrate-binding protein AQN-1-like n=1 Tax=Sapajus apella TaxID=9515 RepID=A0A6J3I798_SAPAP|nr:carbohydrate-binding protein AQN-1-like [Sapajus apella]
MRLSRAFAWALLCTTATTVTAPYATAPSDCGGHYTDDYGRIINYVGPKTECVWVIEYEPGEIPMVAIQDLSKLTCGKEYVEVLDGPPGSESLARICRGFTTFYRSSSNIITIKYSREPSHPPSFFEIYYFIDVWAPK